MNIKVTEVIPAVSQRYPYSHRVEVSADAFAADKVSSWMNANNIPYTSTSWGVYYMKKSDVEWLVLRWS